MPLRPCLSHFLPAGWGGQKISGPRLEQLLWKFATQHLNAALVPGGTVQTTGWTRQRALDLFTGDRRRQAQSVLGPADGVLLEFLDGTVRQEGGTLTIHSRYAVESADISATVRPPIGADRQALIEQGLRVAVANHLPAGSEIALTGVWETNVLKLLIMVEL